MQPNHRDTKKMTEILTRQTGVLTAYRAQLGIKGGGGILPPYPSQGRLEAAPTCIDCLSSATWYDMRCDRLRGSKKNSRARHHLSMACCKLPFMPPAKKRSPGKKGWSPVRVSGIGNGWTEAYPEV
jgi:hypothetical protein